MKRREFVFVLLCLLILSNMATYLFTRFFFSPPVLELEVSQERDGVELFWEVWDILQANYFKPLDEEVLVRGAIKGMLQSLDDSHSAYLTPESFEDLLINATGSLNGIGVVIVEDEGEILILRVIEGSPAQQNGLLPGDRIYAVDGNRDLSLEQTVDLLRGPSETTVDVTIRRAGENGLLSFTLTRAAIEMDTVFARFLEEGIGYIQITSFDRGTGRDFYNSLASLEKEGLKGLVIDLRDNPGGLPEEAIAVGEIIVPSGEITRQVDRHGNVREQYFSAAEQKQYAMVVLVNAYTASAAEILAGALQDREAAVLVGTTTYGKASVQSLQYLSDGGGLRYTIARYLTPGGYDWHEKGLKADFTVNLPWEYYLQYQPVPRDLEPGDTGEKIILLQKMLEFLGYPLETTGVFDAQTVNVLLDFQKKHDLPPTGTLDISTRESLRHALSEKAGEVDKQLLYALELLR